jgi:hypothetical protein
MNTEYSIQCINFFLNKYTHMIEDVKNQRDKPSAIKFILFTRLWCVEYIDIVEKKINIAHTQFNDNKGYQLLIHLNYNKLQIKIFNYIIF